MKTLQIFAALVLSALPGLTLPGLALAEGCHDKASASCTEGMVWDSAKGTCVERPSA